MLNFQGVSSLIRSEPVLRNLISPVNVFSGTYKAVFKDGSTEVDAPRIVIDPKPALGASHKNDKGTLFIVVVGETARLANWGLAGYSRDTTPQLRARNVIPFSKTISCGTSTDVSLPCMFSRVGRDRYDRDRILKEESLLPVLQRAGINVFGSITNPDARASAKASHLCPFLKPKPLRFAQDRDAMTKPCSQALIPQKS